MFYKALRKLRGSSQNDMVEDEMNELRIEKEKSANNIEISYINLFNKPSLRRALLVSIM